MCGVDIFLEFYVLLYTEAQNPSYTLASIPRYDNIVRTAGWAGSAHADGRRGRSQHYCGSLDCGLPLVALWHMFELACVTCTTKHVLFILRNYDPRDFREFLKLSLGILSKIVFSDELRELGWSKMMKYCNGPDFTVPSAIHLMHFCFWACVST